MNLRHAAALALVGWYLMAPPATCPLLDGVMCKEPLSQWSIVEGFDAAQSCNNSLTSLQNFWGRLDLSNPAAHQSLKRVVHYQCVSTDDPRLKGK